MIGATFKRILEADQNCAFLCQVSTRTDDHNHHRETFAKIQGGLGGRSANEEAGHLSAAEGRLR